jgi:hypothetical protein
MKGFWVGMARCAVLGHRSAMSLPRVGNLQTAKKLNCAHGE